MMNDNQTFEGTRNQHLYYEIRLKGHLDAQWADWFEGLTISLEEDGDTLLTGTVMDQAALYGLLKKVRDLGLPLVSVSPLEPGQVDPAQPAAAQSAGLGVNPPGT